MNPTPTPTHAAPAGPEERAGHPADYVTVDDGGSFSYHPSRTALLAGFEYIDEAACIIDRTGTTFDLAMDADRHLRLGPSFGPVELHWLRKAWLDEQRRHPRDHPLHRFYPSAKDAVLAEVFEILELERGPVSAPWTLIIDGKVSHPATLPDVGRQLAGNKHLAHIFVEDPFGHTYRPIRHRMHAMFPLERGYFYYVEIPKPTAQAA